MTNGLNNLKRNKMRKILIKLLGLDVPFTQIKIELSELHRRLDFIQEQFKKK
jgi:hypothetical protein